MVQKKFKKRKNKQTKVNLVFDEKAREDFLTGFKKRKDERRKRAREQLEQQFKEEKKRIRQKEKDKMLARIRSQMPLELPEEVLESKTFDLPNHTVSITEVAEVDLVNQDGTMLGDNKVEASEDETKQEEVIKKTKKKNFDKKKKNYEQGKGPHKRKRRKELLNPFDPKKGTKGKHRGAKKGGAHGQKRRGQQRPQSK